MKYYVRGICLVPHQVGQLVEAKNEVEAERKAKSEWKKHIHQDGDTAGAFNYDILNCEPKPNVRSS